VKRAFILILLLVVALAGALTVTFMPAKLPLTTLVAGAPPAAHPPASMRLVALPAGTMKSSAGFAFRGGRFEDERTFAMGGILVTHPDGKLLFDTGFGRGVDEHVKRLPLPMQLLIRHSRGTPVAEQLAKLGVAPRELKGVFLTHAHWDHVSGLEDLRGAPVWLPKNERKFVDSGERSSELLRSFGNLDYRAYDFSARPYLGFERSFDVFADGSVVLVEAGGHTPGSMIAFIHLPDGKRYALIGDIAWQSEGVSLPTERPWLVRRMVDVDAARVREVLVRLHMLKKRDPALVIVPAHDARVWATLPKPPR
jgi:N-acyl homoserine lactone hydrolase